MTQAVMAKGNLAYLQWGSLFIGLAGTVGCIVAGSIDREQFSRSYLMGFLYWVSLPLGCSAILMIQYLIEGSWGFVIRRQLEAAIKTMPLMTLLFIPVLLQMQALFAWARPEAVAHDTFLQHKQFYLNPSFFTWRAVGYFAIWNVVAIILARWSRRQDLPDGFDADSVQGASGAGLILYTLTVTFACVDWMMSLEPQWYSTVYGAIYAVAQILESFAFVSIVTAWLYRRGAFGNLVTRQHFHDLGTLTFVFVMLWAYMSFGQFLIIWSGNLPDEGVWYQHRIHAGWQIMTAVVAAFHFLVPWLLLLSRDVKRNEGVLAAVAIGILVMRLVDMFWHVMPPFQTKGPEFHWLDLLVMVGMGGIWLSLFVWNLRRRPLLPQYSEVPKTSPQVVEDV